MFIHRVSLLAALLVVSLCVAGTQSPPARADSRLTFRTSTFTLPLGGAEIVAASPNGKLAAVTQPGGSVIFLDISNPHEPTVLDVVAVCTEPEGLVWVPLNRLLLVGNEISGNVTAIAISQP